jgi:hypothetical protein
LAGVRGIFAGVWDLGESEDGLKQRSGVAEFGCPMHYTLRYMDAHHQDTQCGFSAMLDGNDFYHSNGDY